jgi:peroxiredoxin
MKTMKQLLLGLAVLLAIGMDGFSAEREVTKPEFKNETGWIWQMDPLPADWPVKTIGGGLILRLDELKDEKLLLTTAYLKESARDVVKLRAVAFSTSGQRFEFKEAGRTSTKELVLEGHALDFKEAAREKIKFFGVEKLTKENAQKVIAPTAFRKLKEAGVAALPYPVVGQPYEFDLTAIDGKRISSKDFRGKVVLLDFWARWCTPCMAKMPKLKETFRKLNRDGFEIIGLNHDQSLEVAKRTIAKQELPWPNVLAPVEQSYYELWRQTTGIFETDIPRLLLLDRDGVLRADVSPDGLQAAIDELMDKK